jgi:hypothetical protein
MDIEPFCHCPQCKTFGLHYMARVHTNQSPRFMQVVKLQEIPRVQWYDQRENLPPTQLKYNTYTEVVTEITESIVRQCFNCQKEWHQVWKTRQEMSDIATGLGQVFP